MQKKQLFAGTLALCLLFTAGCSKKVEKIEIIEEDTQVADKQDDFEQFREEKTWNDDLQGTIDGKKVSVSIFAGIKLPEFTQSVVAEVVLPEFSAAYKKLVLQGIFQNEEIYYHDMAHWTADELRAEIASKEWYDSVEQYGVELGGDSSFAQEVEDGRKYLKELRSHLVDAKAEYTKVTEFNTDTYIAKYNGDWYETTFVQQENGNRAISFRPAGNSYQSGYEGHWENNGSSFIFSISSEKYYHGPEGRWEHAASFSMSEANSIQDEENLCKLTGEEAEKELIDFADKMGISSLSVIENKNLLCDGNYDSDAYEQEWKEEEPVPYGYGITFGLGLNGESLFGTKEEEFSGTAKVADEGVISFYIKNPIEQKRISEHVDLLSIDKIKEAFRSELSQHLDKYYGKDTGRIKFDTLKLVYLLQMKDEKNREGAYLPVWVLEETREDLVVRVYVNAIDGTVLDENSLQ